MKTSLLFLSLLLISTLSFGQTTWSSGTNLLYTNPLPSNVGIGTATPFANLHIFSDVFAGGSNPKLVFQSKLSTSGNPNYSSWKMEMVPSNGNGPGSQWQPRLVFRTYPINSSAANPTTWNDVLTIHDQGIDVIGGLTVSKNIIASKYIGIGTQTPFANLHIFSDVFAGSPSPSLVLQQTINSYGTPNYSTWKVELIGHSGSSDLVFRTNISLPTAANPSTWTDVLTLNTIGLTVNGTLSGNKGIFTGTLTSTGQITANGGISATTISTTGTTTFGGLLTANAGIAANTITTTGNATIGGTLSLKNIIMGNGLGGPGFANIGDMGESASNNWGNGFIGFNMNRLTSQWSIYGDGNGNGSSIIFSDIAGSLYFGSNPSTGGTQKSITDVQMVQNIKMHIKSNGNVGIGTLAPRGKLDVVGGSSLFETVGIGTTNTTTDRLLVKATGETGIHIDYTAKKDNSGNDMWGFALPINVTRDLTQGCTTKAFAIIENGVETFKILSSGVVNTKKIYAESIEVRTDALNINWFDNVFHNDYKLRPLAQVEDFVKKNSHLPEIPSESEVKEKGINIAQMDGLLLKKIEELTLYVIQQQKEIELLKTQVNK